MLWISAALLLVIGLWTMRQRLMTRLGIDTLEPAALMASPDESPPLLVDVREPGEYARGHIPGAYSLPLSQLARRSDELPRDRELVLLCQHGPRSAVAATLLRARGFEQLSVMEGGMKAWTGA